MNLKTNYFDLFGLPQSYQLDEALLRTTHRALLQEVHPDRFVSHSAQEQRLATQYTALVNMAFDTLISPVKRAAYLLKQLGTEIDFEHQTIKDVNFLMEQMSMREQLVAAKHNPHELLRLIHEIKTEYQKTINELEPMLSSFAPEKKEQAIELVLRLKFFEQLLKSAPLK